MFCCIFQRWKHHCWKCFTLGCVLQYFSALKSSTLKTFHFTLCFGVFFSAENINFFTRLYVNFRRSSKILQDSMVLCWKTSRKIRSCKIKHFLRSISQRGFNVQVSRIKWWRGADLWGEGSHYCLSRFTIKLSFFTV